MNVLFEKLKDINFRSLKLNLLLDIIELTLLQNKALSSYCMVGRNPFDSSVSLETFFKYCKGIQFFKVISIAKQKFNL